MAVRRKKSRVTAQDIDTLFRLAELYNTDYDFQAAEWFWGQFHEKTIEDFTSKYSHGSREYQFFERITTKWALVGVLVEERFLTCDPVLDRYRSLPTGWAICNPTNHGR